jgi:hypothetical protein
MSNIVRLISHSPELREALEALRQRVLRQNELLLPKVPEHPGPRILKIVLPRGHRELVMLLAISQYLPRQVRVELETVGNRTTYSPDELYRLSRVVDTLDGIHDNDRFLFGRLLPEMVRAVNSILCFLSYPKRAKKRSRPRGYRDHGSLQPVDARARREADRVGYILAEQERAVKESKDKDYWDATKILEAERRGISTTLIQELLAREEVRPDELSQYLPHLLDEEPTAAVGLPTEVLPSSSTGSELTDLKFD